MAAVALDTALELLLEVDVFSSRDTDPMVTFLNCLIEQHDVSETEFFVDDAGHPTVLARRCFGDHLNYSDRN